MASDVLLAVDHPLASRDELTLAELADYPVIRPRNFEHYCRSVVDEYLRQGLRSSVIEIATDDEPVDLGEAGDAYSFIFVGNVTGAPEGFVIRRLVRSDVLSVPICISSLRGARGFDLASFRHALSRLSLFG